MPRWGTKKNSFINIKSVWIRGDIYPRPQNLPYLDRVLSSEGRFMRRSEVGQSESWPEGQPERVDAAPGDVPRKHQPGGPGFPSGP